MVPNTPSSFLVVSTTLSCSLKGRESLTPPASTSLVGESPVPTVVPLGMGGRGSCYSQLLPGIPNTSQLLRWGSSAHLVPPFVVSAPLPRCLLGGRPFPSPTAASLVVPRTHSCSLWKSPALPTAPSGVPNTHSCSFGERVPPPLPSSPLGVLSSPTQMLPRGQGLPSTPNL